MSEIQATRIFSGSVKVTNIERKRYSIVDGKVLEDATTRSDEKDVFEIARADFSTGSSTGYAYILTHPKVNKVYFYTEDGDISDTIQNKVLASFIKSIPNAVENNIAGLPSEPSLPQLPDTISNFAIGPLLRTKWNQEYPYNCVFPKCLETNKRYYVGCTNVAVGQVIAYCGKFSSTNSENQNINFKRLTRIDFEGSNATQIDKEQLSSFLYEVALKNKSTFTPTGTPASLLDATNYLKELGYDCEFLYPRSFDFGKISKSLFNLNNPIPVIVCGFIVGGSGHAWVIDGISKTSNGFQYHQNFGWSGRSDGWMDAELLGTDYKGNAYQSGVQMIYINNY